MIAIAALTSSCADASAPAPVVAPSASQDTRIPPVPGPEARAGYIRALDTIDRDIVHGDEEKAVDRGRNQCPWLREWPKVKMEALIQASKRFTSPNHPKGFGAAKEKGINNAIKKYICPT
ncbi:hypothetical protein ACIBKY_43060 [Nonomuraea sp. NPDC050394]|uniref:hypothetical protein n=1 Tax=Nonomuraea sp. NPDC050394 TaxID=3364363 RepID=UPI0037AE80D0